MKTSTTILIILALLIIGFVAWPRTKTDSMTPVTSGATVTQNDSIEGCYVATLAKDIYTLEVKSQNENEITGTLEYKNFEKDSSSGQLVATYNEGLLVGDYSFASEGTNSVRQVAFKKVPDGFVQGFAQTTVDGKGGRETIDLNNLSYDNSPTYVKTQCAS